MIAEHIYRSVRPALPIVAVDLLVLATLRGFLVPLFEASPLLADPFALLVTLFIFFLLPSMPLFYTLHVSLTVNNTVGLLSSVALGTWTVALALFLGWYWVAVVTFIVVPLLFVWVPWIFRMRRRSTGTATR